jgi:hypothetical protein
MTCHEASVAAIVGGEFAFAYAGTVYQADGVTPAAGAEVGVRSGTTTYSSYSASDGAFWMAPTAVPITWTAVDVRVRNANGEKIKASTDATEPDCNECHAESPTSGATVLKAP